MDVDKNNSTGEALDMADVNVYADEVELIATLKELKDKTNSLIEELFKRYEKNGRKSTDAMEAGRLCKEIRTGLELIKECEADILTRPDLLPYMLRIRRTKKPTETAKVPADTITIKTVGMEDQVLQHAFQQMDCDGDGKINGDDLGRVFKHLNADEIANIIASMDVNEDGSDNGIGDGLISWEQFSGAMRAEAVGDDDLRGAFNMYDTNGDGKITLDELYNTLQGFGIQLSKQQVQTSLKNADTNSDGEIDFEEFRKLFHATATDTTITIRDRGVRQ